jgi:ribokinase
MHDVTVLGSLNLDVVISLDRVPSPGETVLADLQQLMPGGKGLNQAVACARAGARTRMIGAVGDDDAAQLLVDAGAVSGVDVAGVRRVAGPSGTAWVMVQTDGDNAIVVHPGANGTLDGLRPDELEAVEGCAVLLMQLEIPLPAVLSAALLARSAGTTVVLNAAPARALPQQLLEAVDVLVVNEHEAVELGSAATSARALVVTLGAAGARLTDADGTRDVPGVAASVVDTTGAGDAFTGYLAAGLAAGVSLDVAAARAVVAGALAVETRGAVPSIPGADAVDARAST